MFVASVAMQINLDVLNFNIILMNISFFGALCRMENIGNILARDGVGALLEGVAQCEGISRKSWLIKCVSLMNEASVLVGKGICHNISLGLIIDSDNRPLGDDCVAIQIVESLSENKIPFDWVFQLRLWHIRHVILNGASLYDHEQRNIFNLASRASLWHSHVGAHPYESSWERRNSDKILKKVALLSVDSIANVSTKSCCSRNCL